MRRPDVKGDLDGSPSFSGFFGDTGPGKVYIESVQLAACRTDLRRIYRGGCVTLEAIRAKIRRNGSVARTFGCPPVASGTGRSGVRPEVFAAGHIGQSPGESG